MLIRNLKPNGIIIVEDFVIIPIIPVDIIDSDRHVDTMQISTLIELLV